MSTFISYTLIGLFTGAAYAIAASGLVRLTPSGSRDPAFIPDLPAGVSDVRVLLTLADGRLYVGGRSLQGSTASDWLVRLNANGSRDVGSFNILQGYREIDFQMPGDYDYGAVLALQGGKPVLAGSVQASGSNTDYDFGVARLMNDFIFADRFGTTPQDD